MSEETETSVVGTARVEIEMSDIVERLRELCDEWDGSGIPGPAEPRIVPHCRLLREAAATIERLTKERDELRMRQAMSELDEKAWVLVPAKATRAWASTMANQRQGQSSTPRCEPPGEYEIQWSFDRIAEVLAAAPASTRDDVLEEAAKIADEQAKVERTERLDKVKTSPDECAYHLWAEQTAEGIAAKLRSLKGGKS